MYPTSAPKGPGKAGYVIGALLLIVGVVGGTALIVVGAVSTVERVDSYQRVSVGGTVNFSSTGRYNAYYERLGVQTRADIPPGLQVELVGPTGISKMLASDIDRSSVNEHYSLRGREGVRITGFRVDRSGRYEVRVLGEPTSAVIAFGRAALTGAAVSVLAGLLGGGFLSLVGFILLIVTAVRRSRHRRRPMSGGPGYGGPGPGGPWPGPPGPGYGGPGYGGPGHGGPGPLGPGSGGPGPGGPWPGPPGLGAGGPTVGGDPTPGWAPPPSLPPVGGPWSPVPGSPASGLPLLRPASQRPAASRVGPASSFGREERPAGHAAVAQLRPLL